MHRVILLWAGLFVTDVHDYSRSLDAGKLDQATLDTEKIGAAKALKREDDGLRITIAPGEAEAGWKTPQGLRVGGNFTITARFVIHKLPKPAQEDGVAIGLAVATQNLDQPDATFIRLVETNGRDVYRSIEKANDGPQMGGMPGPPGMPMQIVRGMGMPGQPGQKPPKPVRKTVPAKGQTFRLELRREGQTLRYSVLDAESETPRYVGQTQLGPGDVTGIKLFAANRNGADAVDVVFRDLAIHADRINGLGTEVRTVFGEIIHGTPSAIEDGKLVVGGPAQGPTPAPGGAVPPPGAGLPAAIATPAGVTVMAAAPAAVVVAAAPAAVVAPAPAAPAPVAPPPGATAAPVQAPQPAPAQAANAPAAPPAKPKARAALDEVESISFESTAPVSGRFLGQPNVDFTRPGTGDPKEKDAAAAAKADDVLAPPPGTVAVKKIPKLEPAPNGIRDLHLTLANLHNAAITQVTVNAQTDKGASAWRLDTSNSHDWPLVLRRAGHESWADLFLEPPAGDLNGKNLTVNVVFADGQNANTTIKADQKTDPKLAFDPKAPAPSFDARIYLTGDEQIFGKVEGLAEESLRLLTPWGDRLAIPLARVQGVFMGLPEHKEPAESFARRLRTRGTEDLLLARSKDGEVVAIAGIAEGTQGEKLLFRFQDKTRSLSLNQVEGLVFAARPDPAPTDDLRATFAMTGGVTISGRWKSLEATTWKIETAWGEALGLPAAEVRSVHFRGGQMTYLSDLAPSRVEETPFFTRRAPWRKDVNLAGAPLKMDGRTYEHGLAVHSRSVLTYDLERRYTTFEATVGFDESAQGTGRVDCRVLADDKELYANPDLRADAPPVKLALPVAGVERLKLVVDFGPDQDTGDRVIWADARVFRRVPPASDKPAQRSRTEEPAPAQPRQTPKPGSGE